MAIINGEMEMNIRVNGLIINKKVKELQHMQMGTNMMAKV
jgi:hypothetical protein